MAAIATIRIACDISNFDAPRDIHTGRTPIFWKGNDLQFQLAVFDRGMLQPLDNIGLIVLDIKPMGPEDTAPDVSVLPLMRGEAVAATFDGTVTEETWENGTKQQAVITFTADESSVVARDAWLVIWAETVDDPVKIITICAGRISIRESSGGIDLTPPEPEDRFYNRDQCDALFARRNQNLQDLSNVAAARDNLQLGTAALYDALNEGDMASASTIDVPTQWSVKTYVDDSITAISGSGGSPNHLSNGAFRLNTNGTSATLANIAMVALSDGWMGYQQIAGSSYQATSSIETVDAALQLNCMHITRPVGNTSTQEMRIFRPFTPIKTFPLRGKQVTFSVDLLADTGFPNTASNGINFSATGTTNTANFTKINNKGEFVSQNVVLHAVESVYAIPTDSYARYSFTFNIPANVVQICLRFTHTPYGTGSSVAADYGFRIYRPAVGMGNTEQPFPIITPEADQKALCARYQRILTAFRGSVTQGQPVVQDVVFPEQFMAVPSCTYAANESAPTAFSALPLPADTSGPTVYCAKLTRTATADSASAFFRVFYGFTVPLW
ncbi:MAG: hypothetical protein LBF26_02160 [Puniceicoccales bacterium]|jgi:hypothetical protein|nr:hypothetical protein [Puniceicoccales bacterium]